MKKQLLILLFIFLSASLLSFAQSSSVKVVDLFAKSLFKRDSTGKVDTTKANVLVNFKISDIKSVNKVTILFGSVKDSSDVLNQEAYPGLNQNAYYLNYNGIVKPLLANIETSYIYPFTMSQWKKIQYITVYITDLTGLSSQRIYFQKNF